jgi:gp16 family phage-associated protein
MKQPIRTAEEANQWLDEQGLSKAEVARRFGVSSSLVFELLATPQRPGRKKRGLRGASHNVAVFLGLKAGVATAPKQANPGRPAKATAQQGAQA